MNDTFFTSDTHLFHTNIIQYDNRPFSSLEEMHEAIIGNWNTRVKKGDTVWVLGDFAITWKKSDKGWVEILLSQLNGQKHLVIGNHDRDQCVKAKGWATTQHYKELKLDRGGIHKQRIVMSHYCFRSWNQSGRGSWALHGHSHHNLADIGGKVLDVGCMGHNYAPISIDEVEEFMSTRHVVAVDHHVEEE